MRNLTPATGCRPLLVPLLLLLVGRNADAAGGSTHDVVGGGVCPQVPDGCVCSVNRAVVAVACRRVGLAPVQQSIGRTRIDELRLADCDEPTIASLPFDGLRVLEMTNCNVVDIHATAWDRIATTLEQLTITGNRLTAIPSLGNFSSLVSLNLKDNLISKVDEKAFAALRVLTQLRLSKNIITEFPPKTLDAVKGSLVLLDLSSNRLSSVPAQILRNAGRLTYLDLSGNAIDEVNNFELMNLASLRELRLGNNRLRRVHPMAFMNVPQLEYLHLHDNLIASLDGNRLQAFKRLEMLDVSNNLLHTLPSMKDLPNLKQVRVDGNLIAKIDTLAFSNNPRLQLITLQNNNIGQIARNSFDSLDQLVVLLLGNNSIPKIERGMLDGMRNLQQLSVRNNSLTSLDRFAFASLSQLTTLDLAYNQIATIDEGTFDRQAKLFWLDVSNNRIGGFKKGVFAKKISNILLNGNPLICDDGFDELLTYLVANRVRTFLPFQPEIVCAGPEDSVGVRLKDLMMKKANETLLDTPIGMSNDNQRSLFASLLPSLGSLGAVGQNQKPPVGGGFMQQHNQQQQQVQSNLPGASNGPIGGLAGQNFDQLTTNDIQQLMRSVPNLVVNVPGFGDVDLSKMDPAMVSYVLKGGQLPGVDRATMDNILGQAVQRLRAYASGGSAGPTSPTASRPTPRSRFIRPGKQLPVSQLPVDGQPFSGDLASVQMGQPPIATERGAENGEFNSSRKPGFAFSQEMLDLLNVLPAGYNLSKIPVEVLTAVTRGELPDLRLLPADLLEHFKAHANQLASMLARSSRKGNASIDDVIDRLPVFARPEMSTFVPYDINQLTSEMILDKEVEARHKRIRLFTAIALGLIGVVTVAVLAFFVRHTRRQRRDRKGLIFGNTPMTAESSMSGRSNRVAPTSTSNSSASTFSHQQLCANLVDGPGRPLPPLPAPRRF